jgi:6,7-dimethyl-8-ribityllumazine synthase
MTHEEIAAALAAAHQTMIEKGHEAASVAIEIAADGGGLCYRTWVNAMRRRSGTFESVYSKGVTVRDLPGAVAALNDAVARAPYIAVPGAYDREFSMDVYREAGAAA